MPEPPGHLLVARLEGFSRETPYQRVDAATGDITCLPPYPDADMSGWAQMAW